MKRFLSMLLALCMVMTILPVAALAAGTEVAGGTCGDNLTWTLDSEGTLTISGTGAMGDYPGGQAEQPWGDYSSQIIKVVAEPGVTTIGTRAFSYCFALESVSLPNGLTSIGGYAFAQCSALAQINLPESLTVLGTEAFDSCTALTSIVIPGGVKTIEPFTFEFCSSLTSVTMGEGTTTIGTAAFENCHALTNVTIPSTVTSIGDSAFYSCRSLAQITIPSSVTSLGRMAFGTYYSDSVALEITFEGDAPEMIPTEGSWFGTFQDVTATAYYPAGNPTWTEEVLTANYGGTLTWVAYTSGETEKTEVASGTWGDNLTWTLTADGVLTISGEGEMERASWDDELDGYAYPWNYYSEIVKSLVITEGVTLIPEGAFRGSPITEASLPSTLLKIGTAAFAESALTSIELPDSVTSLGTSAFCECGSLTYAKLPAGLVHAGEGAFAACDRLAKVVMPEMPDYDIDTYSTLSLHALFEGCGALTDIDFVTFPAITEFMFAWCDGLEEITIPSSAESIWMYAFRECANLHTVTIPATVEELRPQIFQDCGKLTTIYFEGDAPEYDAQTYFYYGDPLDTVVATAYYPADNDTWTKEVMASYGGDITWVPYTPSEEMAGDLNGDDVVDDSDVAQLLWYTLFGEEYAISGSADFTGNGTVDDADVAYLLWYTLFPDDYPLQ